MPKRTLLLILALAGVTVLLIYIALSQNSNNNAQTAAKLPSKTISQTKTAFNTAQTVLSLSPNSLTISANATSSAVNLIANTNTNSISGVQIELAYNPTKLTDVSISSGSFFPNPSVLLNKIDKINGRMFYAIVLPAGEKNGIKGNGIIATINFKSLMTPGEQTQIKFFPKTLVIAPNINKSLLKETNGATIIAPQSKQTTIIPLKTNSTSGSAY